MSGFLKEIKVEDIAGKSIFIPNISEKVKTKESNEFESLVGTNKIFMVKISAVGPDLSLRVGLGDKVVGVIPSTEVLIKKTVTKRELKSFVDKELPVVVTQISEDGSIVYMSVKKAKEIVREYYRKNLKPGDIVSAVVVYYNPKKHRILLDIECCGLYGYIPLKEWSYKYIYNPEEQIKVGTITNVKVEKFYNEKVIDSNHYKAHYRCSRLATLPNPWIGIETRCPVGTEMVVTVSDLLEHNFFASTSISSEIEVYCEYPDNYKSVPIQNATMEDQMSEPAEPKIIIQKGEKYLVTIYKVSEEKRALMGRVKRHIAEPSPSTLINQK